MAAWTRQATIPLERYSGSMPAFVRDALRQGSARRSRVLQSDPRGRPQCAAAQLGVPAPGYPDVLSGRWQFGHECPDARGTLELSAFGQFIAEFCQYDSGRDDAWRSTALQLTDGNIEGLRHGGALPGAFEQPGLPCASVIAILTSPR